MTTLLVPGVDLEALLHAIARVETQGGRNNWPRVEVSYMPVGERFTVQGRILVGTGRNFNAVVSPRWDRWGLASAASWGPWQILYHTAADMKYTGAPYDLMAPGVCEPFVILRLQRIAATGAKTVRDFADGWNSGSWRDANLVPEYTAKVVAAYEQRTGGPVGGRV